MSPSDGLDWLKDEALEWARGLEEFASIKVNDFVIAVFSALEQRDGLWAELDAYNGLGTDEERLDKILAPVVKEAGDGADET